MRDHRHHTGAVSRKRPAVAGEGARRIGRLSSYAS